MGSLPLCIRMARGYATVPHSACRCLVTLQVEARQPSRAEGGSNASDVGGLWAEERPAAEATEVELIDFVTTASFDPEDSVLDGDSVDMGSFDDGGEGGAGLRGRGHVLLLGLWPDEQRGAGRTLAVHSGRCASTDAWAELELGEIRANSTKQSYIRPAPPPQDPAGAAPSAGVPSLRSLQGHYILCGSVASMPGGMRGCPAVAPRLSAARWLGVYSQTIELQLCHVTPPDKPERNATR